MKRFVIKDLAKKENIVLDESILLRLYCTFKGIELKEEQELENIIKIMLPEDEAEALEILLNGLKVEDKLFLPLVTSPSLQKKDDSEENAKCEYLFILEEDKEFVELYEKLISLGKLDKLKGKNICINKDVTSRLALSTSSANKIDFTPNIVILPEINYTYTSKYFLLENNELKRKDKTVEHTFADGCGFMSDKCSKIIQQQLNLDYRVDFAQVRMYNGLAIKGLLVRADFQRFFEENYEKTDYFWKDENGDFITIDVFNNKVNISKADIILNETMVKWVGLWKDEEFTDINLAIKKELAKDIYAPYRSDLESLYVMKVNKKQLKGYNLSNYQLLLNLALTPNDLEELARPTFELYDKMINKHDIDAIRLYLGDIQRNKEESKELAASTKAHRLLQIDERFASTKFVQRNINALIKKSCHELAGGKMFIENASYKMAMIDPICYLRWIMKRDVEMSRELKVGEFYVAGKESDKVVISRNPMAVFSEAHQIKLVKTNLLDKYFGNHTEELFFMNQADDTAMTSSGADFDGDAYNCIIDNEIIYNAVIPPKEGRHFLNIADGEKVEMEYTRENMYLCILRSSGNLIGKISNIATKISDFAQKLEYAKRDQNKNVHFFTWKELRECYIQHYSKLSSCKTDEELKVYKLIAVIQDANSSLTDVRDAYKKINECFKEELEGRLKSKSIRKVEELKDEHIRNSIINNFYKEQTLKEAYYTLYQTQRAIDAPKTLVFPNKNDLKSCKTFCKSNGQNKKPYFIYYSKWSKNFENKNRVAWDDCSHTQYTAMNKFAGKVQKELISKINEKTSDNSKRKLYSILESIAKENEECNAKVKKLYSKYNDAITTVTLRYKAIEEKSKNKKLTDKERVERFKSLEKYNLKAIETMLKIEKIFEVGEIAKAIINAKCNSKFIVDFCFNILEEAILSNKENKLMGTNYVEDQDGNIEFLFKRYSKVDCMLIPIGDMTDKEYKDKLRKVNTDGLNLRIGDIKEDLEQDKKIKIAVEEYNGKEQFIITNSEDKKIGFIFNNKKLNVEQVRKAIGKEFKIKHIETKNKSATLFLVS
ncbi:RNA dependent RNA polymerase [Clostridium perfringens]|uniref:RNA dependent RNA polymerase n=1 Tax=Clostridium perfringens TaxID=1502 RepID=UPI000F52F8B0|nr:hypothetical protein [Clostridium perfringens]